MRLLRAWLRIQRLPRTQAHRAYGPWKHSGAARSGRLADKNPPPAISVVLTAFSEAACTSRKVQSFDRIGKAGRILEDKPLAGSN